MDCYSKLQNAIEDKKWFRNDIGFEEFQFIKLIIINEILMVLIISNNCCNPIYVKVESMRVANGQIIIYYNSKQVYGLDKDKYYIFKDYVTEDEWNMLFEERYKDYIEKNKLINKDKYVIAQIYKNIDNIIDVDDKASQYICEKFNLI